MKNNMGVVICEKNIGFIKSECEKLNFEGIKLYAYPAVCFYDCQNLSHEFNNIFSACIKDNSEITVIYGEKCFENISNYYDLNELNCIKLSTCFRDYNILKQAQNNRPMADFKNHPDSLIIAKDYVRTTIENIIMKRNMEKTIMVANQKIADYAAFCDLISELNNKASEREVAAGIMSLFSMFYGGKGSIYISLDEKGKVNFVNRHAILKKDAEKEIEELVKVNHDYVWNDIEQSITIRIKSGQQILGIFKIMGIKTSSYKEYFLNFSLSIGKVCGMVVSNARNYEKLKKSQLELFEEKKKLSDIFNTMSEMVIVSDSDQRIVFANKAVLKASKVPDIKQIAGMKLTDFILDDYTYLINNWTQETILKHNRIAQNEVKLLESDGEFWHAEVSCSPIKFNQNIAMLMIIRDITEKKLNQELNKKVEEKSKQLSEVIEYEKLRTEFFANFAHELRTPLNVISGSLQLTDFLLNNDSIKVDKSKMLGYNKIMMQNCYRLVRIANKLIDVSKIDAKFYKLNRINENIVDIVENITQQSACFLKDKGLEIIFDTDVEEKIMAFDIEAIEKIMLNLLSNAAKFTEKNGTINVNIIGEDDFIEISVKDNGIGIPEEKQKNIFDRFTQVNKSFSRRQEGIGAGLFIVKSLVNLHNGEVILNSKSGVGSEFIIKLPYQLLECDSNVISNSCIRMGCDEKVKIEFSDIYFQ